MTADPHNDWGINTWPEPEWLQQLRDENTRLHAHLETMRALVLDRETNGGGLIEACRARTALGMGPRPRHKENDA